MNRRARSSLANTFIGMPQGTDEKIPEDVPEAFLKNDSSSGVYCRPVMCVLVVAAVVAVVVAAAAGGSSAFALFVVAPVVGRVEAGGVLVVVVGLFIQQ